MAKKIIPEIENLVEDLGIPGIAAILALPVLIPVAGKALRPLVKTAIKQGMVIYDKGKEIIEEAGETIEDLVAEVKAEMADEDEK